MVVLWCRACGDLMGVREPLEDWSEEAGVCAACLMRTGVLVPQPRVQKQQSEEGEGVS
jgi:hypothetical protein